MHPRAAVPLLRDGDRQPRLHVHGAASSIPAETFEPEATLATCAEERCTSLYGVPTMFIAELGHPTFRRARPRARCAPGSWPARPCPIEVMKRVVERDGDRARSRSPTGMTETSPVSTLVRVDDTLEHRCATVGQVMPHTEIKIVDPATGRIQSPR